MENYIRQSLRLFAADPADSSYQEGFFDCTVLAAIEGLGFSKNDPDIVAAQKAAKLCRSTDPKIEKLRGLTVIDGSAQ